MKNIYSKTILSIMAMLVFSTIGLGQSTDFTYQGRLLDSSLPPTALYDFEFSLWNSLVAGTQAGTTQQMLGVQVTNGIFTVRLDFGAQFTGAARFLQINVKNAPGPFTVLAPRQPITSAPYAVKSLNADTATTATNATNATNAVNATTANSATSFTGNLLGDVSGTQSATVVSTVGGQSAASVANAAQEVTAATSVNTANTLVRRNASGNFSAGTITATGATLNGPLNMTNDLITNIGNAGTDFTATGGLTLAGNLTVGVLGSHALGGTVPICRNPGDFISTCPPSPSPPGVASAASNTTVQLNGTVQTLLSHSITVPTSGFVLVIGTLQADFIHFATTTSSAAFGVSDTAGIFPANQDVAYHIAPAAPTGPYFIPVTVHGLFSVVAGAHTFYLLGEEVSGTTSAGDMQLTLLFVPTSYGTVTSTFADPALDKSAAKPLKTAEQLPAEKALMPKATPDADSPKQQQTQIEQQTKAIDTLKAQVELLKSAVCSEKPTLEICKPKE